MNSAIAETIPAITPRGPLPISPEQGADAAGTARALLRMTRSAALATLDPLSGYPFASTVSLATDIGGAPLMLIARIALHTRNIMADSRVSIVLVPPNSDRLMIGGRMTLTGRAEITEDPGARRRFIACHPKMTLPASLSGLNIWRIEINGIDVVGGPGLLPVLPAADLVTDLVGAEELVAGEADVVGQLNGEYAAQVRLLAMKSAGLTEGGSWRVTGVDPDGIDARLGSHVVRIALPLRAGSPDKLISGLRELSTRP